MYSHNQCHFLLVFSVLFVTFTKSVISQSSYSDEEVSNLSPTNQTKTNQNIPTLPLINYGKKSYYIGTVFKGNFFQSEQFCRYHGMNLVSIMSKEENDFLRQKINEQEESSQRFWTSGTRIPDNVKWIWFTTGKSLTYLSWDEGQPNNAAKDDECVMMQIKNKQLKWYNRGCWEDYNFMCEVTWKDCRTTSTSDNRKNIRSQIDVRYGQ
ncbi:unnamed protein product [Psylliodes chrysocephalus]|uniref:C-type lectin domain-containing protein n=1 Tax=Psylliodes chrysocephalus TaxID=3402493 RepID=A0A9P0D610_9CUCU|nr:unnamed protein product [Psylliodes chrysocephala]